MIKVILDTNILLLPGRERLDIFSELTRIMDEPHEAVVTEGIIDELNTLTLQGKAPDRAAARLAIQLIKGKPLKTIPSSGKEHVDDTLVEEAEKGAIIATQDGALQKRLKSKGCRYIGMRQRRYLYLQR